MIGHTNEGMRAGWFLDSVQLMVPVHGKQYMFPSHRWLCKDEADGKTEVEIYPSEILDMEQRRQHSHTLTPWEESTHKHKHCRFMLTWWLSLWLVLYIKIVGS